MSTGTQDLDAKVLLTAMRDTPDGLEECSMQCLHKDAEFVLRLFPASRTKGRMQTNYEIANKTTINKATGNWEMKGEEETL